jgi:hypothetical protein
MSEPSFLESTLVWNHTQKDYNNRVADFELWCLARRLTWTDVYQLDLILVSLLDEMFFKGHP